MQDCGRDEEGNSVWDCGEREGLADGSWERRCGREREGKRRGLECAGVWEGCRKGESI